MDGLFNLEAKGPVSLKIVLGRWYQRYLFEERFMVRIEKTPVVVLSQFKVHYGSDFPCFSGLCPYL